MRFAHAPETWSGYPHLVAGVLAARGITNDAVVQPRLARFLSTAESRLATHAEAELPEVQAWRRAFSRMGLKPTQYRSASESLLRRYRKEGSLPQIHPLIDLCNAVSLAFAIPVAVFDAAKIADYLEVRPASGTEVYEAFSGELEPGRFLNARDPFGNLIQVVQYDQIQFTKSPEVLRAMALELTKTAEALEELRAKGIQSSGA